MAYGKLPTQKMWGQEVFGSVARKLREFERRRAGSFRKWLWTITDNKCRDFYRALPGADAAGGSNARALLESLVDETATNENLDRDLNGEPFIMRQAMKAVEK